MSLFLPRWPIDRRFAVEQTNKAFVLVTSIAGRRVITAVTVAAATEGITPGMTLAEARTFKPDLGVDEADVVGDAESLGRLALWCERFSPFVAPCGNDGLFLDVTGCAHLFGGEAGLAAQAVARLNRQGIECRATIADNAETAWALSRFGGRKITVVPGGGARAALADLPVAALRIEPQAVSLLTRFGLHRIAELYAMPRAALIARCGEGVGLALDRALGVLAEPLSPLPPASLRWTRRSFAEPIATPEDIAAATRELVETLCRRFAEEDIGARKLTLALHRIDGRVEQATIGTARPERDPRHLWRLFEERLPTLDPGLGIEDMVLTAGRVESLGATQLGFRGATEKDEIDLAVLVDHLTNRLGPRAVARPVPYESHVPERAVRYGSAIGQRKSAWHSDRLRPVRLLHRPEPIDVTAPVPDDPPLFFRWRRLIHRIRRADGPERIEAEWWRAAEEPRDYYRVEDEAGERFWVYRAGLYRPGASPRWFMHGMFG